MKIAHLTSAHSRYDIRIFKKECVSLAKNGYKVFLIVADGLGNESVEGVQILDVGPALNRFDRFSKLPFKILELVKKKGFDVCHFHDPELLLISRKLNAMDVKVVYDIHEDLPQQIMLKTWIPTILRSIISKTFSIYEKYKCGRLDALVVPQPYMELKYKNINPNTFLVENFVFFNQESYPKRTNYNKRPVSFHAGRLTEDRGFFNMISSFENSNIDCELILAGNFNKEIEGDMKELESFKNVKYLGVLPFEQTVDYYKNCDFGVILYNNVGQYYLSYAIKLFEYMSYGIPVIMPDFGEWIEFNKENNCGINVDPKDIKSVSKAIRFLSENREKAEELGRNGYNAVKNKYNWGIAENKLLNLYRSLK